MKLWIAEHERLLCLLGLLALLLIAVIGLGRIEFHNELERDVYPDAFLGCVDDAVYSGTVIIQAEQMPEWCQNLGISGEETVVFADGRSGQIGLFADVVYFENRYERRTWFSGKLLEQASEYYCRLDGPIRLEPVYTPLECEINVDTIKGADYDYMSFKGK
ncbi:MAG: hypothetical protein IKU46_07550 [Peptococcaceae bacterium]|nr:hypothetical protein [Peptococcaceae bacterium]